MFRGRYEHAVDTKGRTSLPARFREALPTHNADRLMMACGLDGCLVAYPPGEWRAFEERLLKLPQFDPNVVRLKRLYVSGAVDCPIDSQGRVLLTPPLRAHAGIARAVVWAGVIQHAEVWSKERWSDVERTTDGDRAALRKALAELGL